MPVGRVLAHEERQHVIIDNLRVEKDPDAEKSETESTEAA